MTLRETFGQLGDLFRSSPITAVAMTAAAVAFATTPLAFAWMGQMQWFNARRGRTLQRPAFWTWVCCMMMVMGIPAIFLALLVKSQYFDKDRYEFDPNRTLSVYDQGRMFEARDALDSVAKLDEAVRNEQVRLDELRKTLVDDVKKLDSAVLALRESARQNPAVVPAMNDVLERMGPLRKAIGIDAPQQLIDLKADPAAIARAGMTPSAAAPAMASIPVPAPTPLPALPLSGLTKPEVDALLAAVPEPQRPIAAMLPLVDLPEGWVLAKIPGKTPAQYIETFNAENLFEKIDGRAESFIQNGVKGMACCSYHPKGDEDKEVQLFIYEMGNPLKARGKFDSEKPDDSKPLKIGDGAYSSAGSTFVHADRYYTISNVAQDDPQLAAFAEEVAKRVAALQKGSASSGPTMEDLFALFPKEPKRSGEKYVAQDVFGYSFLADVFLADYAAGDMTFQGFLRPYASADEAKKVFETYLDTAKKDGAEVQPVADAPADRMIVSKNIGLVDVIFLKGNAVGGANGATDAKPAEEFAKAFAKTLTAPVPVIQGEAQAEKKE